MRNLTLRIANYALYISTMLLVSAGLVLKYRLTGGGRSKGMLLLGISRHDWSELHFIFGIVFIALALLHLYLNWSWVVKVANKGSRLSLVLSILVGVLIVAMSLLSPLNPKPNPSGKGKGPHGNFTEGSL